MARHLNTIPGRLVVMLLLIHALLMPPLFYAISSTVESTMKDIFVDSLRQHANVCNGCFKTIYTLSMQRARELGIPIIVTGLSRGQMFETRLTEEMFRDGRCSPDEVDVNLRGQTAES